MNKVNSERFLNAFIEIEQELRLIVGADRYLSFYNLVKRASSINKTVRPFATYLKEYADLRNAIVHERIDGEPIAEPHDAAVLHLEEILDILTSPPRIEDGFLGEVVTCAPYDPIGYAMKRMLCESFSQFPVYRGSKFVGLLTAETVARWVADRLSCGVGLIEEESVSEVLKFTEHPENYSFIDRKATLFEVISLFEEFNRKGKTLKAVIVTNTGNKDEHPVGILTVFDLSKLYEKVGLGVTGNIVNFP